MRLDVVDLGAGGTAEGVQRADLVQHQRLHFFRRAGHMTTAEAGEVGIGRVRADAHPMLHRQAHGALHDGRVAGMETAGQVGLVDQRHGVSVVAHLPGAEAFTHVAVEEDASSHARSLKPEAWSGKQDMGAEATEVAGFTRPTPELSPRRAGATRRQYTSRR
ncbi:hypothetical protein D3C81_1267400 [compost metagenome]